MIDTYFIGNVLVSHLVAVLLSKTAITFSTSPDVVRKSTKAFGTGCFNISIINVILFSDSGVATTLNIIERSELPQGCQLKRRYSRRVSEIVLSSRVPNLRPNFLWIGVNLREYLFVVSFAFLILN